MCYEQNGYLMIAFCLFVAGDCMKKENNQQYSVPHLVPQMDPRQLQETEQDREREQTLLKPCLEL